MSFWNGIAKAKSPKRSTQFIGRNVHRKRLKQTSVWARLLHDSFISPDIKNSTSQKITQTLTENVWHFSSWMFARCWIQNVATIKWLSHFWMVFRLVRKYAIVHEFNVRQHFAKHFSILKKIIQKMRSVWSFKRPFGFWTAENRGNHQMTKTLYYFHWHMVIVPFSQNCSKNTQRTQLNLTEMRRQRRTEKFRW